ncbi:MAG: glycoside hydrolase, partial [Bacteroidia bacterium]|nr:glycoside hydrolase [Bacteroidia bacterium]
PSNPAQNAGLVAYEDDDNFVKLVYSAPVMGRGMPAGAPAGSVQLIAEDNGNNKATVNASLAETPLKNNTIWLRLVKSGDKYTAYYSADGKSFKEAGSAEILLKDINAGIIACEGVRPAVMGRGGFGAAPAAPQTPSPITASFDYFKVK